MPLVIANIFRLVKNTRVSTADLFGTQSCVEVVFVSNPT